MKLKLDDKGAVVLQDGKPVYVKDDGKEIAFDASEAFNKITALNGENAGLRVQVKDATTAAKAFEGLDATAAKAALEAVKNIDLKKLVDSGEVDKVKLEVSRVFEAQLAEMKGKLEKKDKDLFTEKIGGAFARSKFIAEKCAVPADMIQARFGDRFSIDDNGQIVATDAQGNKIYSKRPESAGSLAGPDEALEILIDQYPYKTHVLKGSGANGGGSQESGAGGGGGATKMAMEVFEKLDPIKQREALKNGVELVRVAQTV